MLRAVALRDLASIRVAETKGGSRASALHAATMLPGLALGDFVEHSYWPNCRGTPLSGLTPCGRVHVDVCRTRAYSIAPRNGRSIRNLLPDFFFFSPLKAPVLSWPEGESTLNELDAFSRVSGERGVRDGAESDGHHNKFVPDGICSNS